MVVSDIILNSHKQAQSSMTQSTMDTLHMIGLQYARNSEKLRETIYLPEVGKNPNLENCFKQKGSNCSSFEEPFKGIDASASSYLSELKLNSVFSIVYGSDRCTGMTPSVECPILRKTQFRFRCSTVKTNSCQGVEILVETTYENFGSSSNHFYNRRGVIFIPASAFISRGDIDFSCASSSNFLTSIDYPNLLAKCEDFNGTDKSTQLQPLKTFATNPSSSSDWQAMESVTCASGSGLGTVGIISGQSACRGPQ